MLHLHLLGEARLVDDQGGRPDALLRQPKHLALLAFLAVPRPGNWHRRDAVLGVFWPDHDQAKARSALRSALYTLRRHLPEGAVRTRGDEELGLSPEVVRSDVALLEDAIAGGRWDEALQLYRGDLLPGFHVADAPGFERWLEGERERARSMAGQAAGLLSLEHAEAGRVAAAIAAARRGAELAPTDETAARRWISLLDRAGDRAGAFAAYERLRDQLNEALGVRPSAETVALMDAIRTRSESQPVDDTAAIPQVPRVPAMGGDAATEPPARGAGVGEEAESPELFAAERPIPSTARWRNGLWAAAALVAVGATAWGSLRGRTTDDASPAARTPILVVLPMRNETQDTRLGYVASGIADGVARRLDGLGGLTIRSGAWTGGGEKQPDLARLGPDLKGVFVLRSSLQLRNDSLQVRAAVVDPASGRTSDAITVVFSVAGIGDAESRLAAAVGGAVFRSRVQPRPSSWSVDPASYQATLIGLTNLLGTGRQDSAERYFEEAVRLDPRNARAWAGLSSVWMARANADQVPLEDGLRRGAFAADTAIALDPRQGAALANLGIAVALRDRSLAQGLALVDSAIAVEPSNPEVWLLKSVLLRWAHRYDDARAAIRFAQYLDPFSDRYAEREVILDFCQGRPHEALQLLKAQLEVRPRSLPALAGKRRALAMLERWDEALDVWRLMATIEGDTAAQRQLALARGRQGFLELRHAEGRAALARFDRSGRQTSLRETRAALFAGDTVRGFAALQRLEKEHSISLHRLSCVSDLDEFRDHPRLVAVVKRAGPLQ